MSASDLNTKQLLKAQNNQLLSAEQFWAFSYQHYKSDEIKDCLHQLQDQHHHNINRHLLTLWLTQKHFKVIQLKPSILPVIEKLEYWIKEVRSLRNTPYIYSLSEGQLERKKVLSLELKLEKLHQKLLLSGVKIKKLTMLNKQSLFKLYQHNSQSLNGTYLNKQRILFNLLEVI